MGVNFDNQYGRTNTSMKPNDSKQANNNAGNKNNDKNNADLFKKGDPKSDPLVGNGFAATA